jgi:superfamily II DNA or RNA helicase
MTQLKIVIKDEVNCKIVGLDTQVRNLLVRKFKYEIPGARFIPMVRLGRWDGCKAFFQLSGQTYIALLPEILPILIDNGYDIEIEDTRNYNLDFQFERVDENSYAHKVWPEGHDRAGQPILLRTHQVDSANTFFENPQSIQMISTGGGKTLLSAVLSHRCEKYGRTVVVVPSKDLVIQTEADYRNMGLDVGVFYGNRKEYNKTHTICTWQSLNSMFKKTKKGEAIVPFSDFIEGVQCIMIDECHGLKADALLKMMTESMAHIPIRWGFTGTIPKEEFQKRSLQVSVGEVVGGISAAELQDRGLLSNCHVHVRQMVDHVVYNSYQDELKYLLETTKRIEHISNMIIEIAKTGNTLVLIDRVEPGKIIAENIPGAVFLSGNSKTEARKEQYESIETSENSVTVCTFGIASTGINIVSVYNLVLIEPGKSFIRVIQSIGRGLRKGSKKDFVDIYDITSTCKFSKRHLTARKSFYKEANYPFSVEKVEWQK